MTTAAKAYNKNNAGVKRILREAAELANDPSPDFTAHPLERDLFDWHCTLRGPPGTEFEGGLYHFRIVLPAEYPFRPPSIILLTPNGRFECGTKICISFTNYHEELWQPAWGVRTAIVALQGFFPLKGQAAIGVGAVEFPDNERRRLATLSRDWVCPDCGSANKELFSDKAEKPEEEVSSISTSITDPTRKASKSLPLSEPKAPTQEEISRPKNPDSTNQPQNNSQSQPPASEPIMVHQLQAIQGNRVIVAPQAQAQASRPPFLLDATICTLMVFAAALLFRKIF